MNHLSKLYLIIVLISSVGFSSKMWKISTVWGDNLSATELVRISNDSLHTIVLGLHRQFAIQDIIRITRFNRNVNQMMLFGAIVGGSGGLITDSYIKGNNKIDIKNNGAMFTIAGLVGGTLMGHILSANNSVDLSKLDLNSKKEIIASMIILSDR